MECINGKNVKTAGVTDQLAQTLIQDLITAAIAARKNSYSPYSHYQVGAALLAGDGQIITGCNIENAAYGPTNCAERTAFFKAVSEGVREFCAIAIVGSPEGDELTQYAYPCGVCRQVMMEFCNPADFQIIVAKSTEDYHIMTLRELLPEGFGPGNLR
ncbi:MAG: cytidine deaminase [Lachnospiraceae bacterium]|nr:cytidine deaminase [Lachnospiraceae bacterium]